MLTESIWIQINGMALARKVDLPDLSVSDLMLALAGATTATARPTRTEPTAATSERDGSRRTGAPLAAPPDGLRPRRGSDEVAADPDLPDLPFCRIPRPRDVHDDELVVVRGETRTWC